MRINNLKAQIAMLFPYDTPDRNGVTYSKQAVEQAVTAFQGSLPIVYRDNDSCTDGQIVGHINGETTSVIWDENAKVCEVVTVGVVYFGGTECTVNEMEDGVVTSFKIQAVGLSK